MSDITIQMRDGTTREFRDTPRAGGSYEKKIRYEGQMAIVTDEWYEETAIPIDLILEVKVASRGGW